MNNVVAGSLLAATLFTAFLTPVYAQDGHAGPDDGSHEMAMSEALTLGNLTVSNSWTRAMPPAAVAGGGYVSITNTGDQADRLVSAISNVGGVVEIHEMSIVDDVMRMQSLPDGLIIPAGQTVELKPGGFHLMFIGVESQFVEGEEVPVTLTFEQAGSIDLILPVAPMGSSMPPMDHAHH